MTPNDKGGAFDGTRREPVNREASLMFAKGLKPPSPKTGVEQWEICPALHSPAMVRKLHPNKEGVDLTGTRFGRMAVEGLSKIHSPARWICRCSCGIYEIRTAKAVKNPNNGSDCCHQCRLLIEAKKHHHFHTTGRELVAAHPECGEGKE